MSTQVCSECTGVYSTEYESCPVCTELRRAGVRPALLARFVRSLLRSEQKQLPLTADTPLYCSKCGTLHDTCSASTKCRVCGSYVR